MNLDNKTSTLVICCTLTFHHDTRANKQNIVHPISRQSWFYPFLLTDITSNNDGYKAYNEPFILMMMNYVSTAVISQIIRDSLK